MALFVNLPHRTFGNYANSEISGLRQRVRVFPAQRRAGSTTRHATKIIESLKFDISSTMKALEAALSSLELPDFVNYAQTAREYGVDPTTLRRRHKAKKVSRHQAAFESKSLFIDT
jgi:hypothetical protein